MAFARHQFTLARRQPDGRTQRQHLEQALRQARTGERRAELRAKLAGPPMPAGYQPVYDVFLELDRWRGGGGMGAAPLTLHDVETWERRFLPAGHRLTPEELDLIKRLDMVALTPEPKDDAPPIPKHPPKAKARTR